LFACRPIIGLVGGIAAGKSHVARLFEAAGCCRIASDEMVRAAYTHPEVKRAVVERFGDEVMDGVGQIDRKRIADIVFRNVAERQWLESLLHPVANQARVELMERAARDPAVVGYVWDSPLLLETGLDKLCDVVIFVDAPLEDRVRRAVRRGWDAAELHRREKVQMPLDKKRTKADYVLENADARPASTETVTALLSQILDRVGTYTQCCGGSCASGEEGGVCCQAEDRK
jgi:dephospho-CoA kinase